MNDNVIAAPVAPPDAPSTEEEEGDPLDDLIESIEALSAWGDKLGRNRPSPVTQGIAMDWLLHPLLQALTATGEAIEGLRGELAEMGDDLGHRAEDALTLARAAHGAESTVKILLLARELAMRVKGNDLGDDTTELVEALLESTSAFATVYTAPAAPPEPVAPEPAPAPEVAP